MDFTPHPLLQSIRDLDPRTAAERLAERSDEEIGALLTALHVGHAVEILEEFPEERRQRIAAASPLGAGLFWLKGDDYPEGTVGRLIERPPAVFRPEDTIAFVTETLREIVKKRMVVYIFVTEPDGHLVGLVAFRELLFAHPDQKLSEIMIQRPFALRPETELVDAMRDVVTRHYPVYPVVDADSHLLGMVRGQVLFEQQAYEISAQAGLHGGRREGGAPRDSLDAQLQVPPPVAAAQPVHRVHRGDRGGILRRNHQPDRAAGRCSCRCSRDSRATPAARRSRSRCAA
jgi:magnesium transporter